MASLKQTLLGMRWMGLTSTAELLSRNIYCFNTLYMTHSSHFHKVDILVSRHGYEKRSIGPTDEENDRTQPDERKGNVLFNDALNTFYLQLYDIGHMVKDHSDSERGNPLLPYRVLFLISSKGSFICIIPQTG